MSSCYVHYKDAEMQAKYEAYIEAKALEAEFERLPKKSPFMDKVYEAMRKSVVSWNNRCLPSGITAEEWEKYSRNEKSRCDTLNRFKLKAVKLFYETPAPTEFVIRADVVIFQMDSELVDNDNLPSIQKVFADREDNYEKCTLSFRAPGSYNEVASIRYDDLTEILDESMIVISTDVEHPMTPPGNSTYSYEVTLTFPLPK